MFKLFNRNQEKASVVGRRAELSNDVTKFQYGAIFLDDIRYSVRTNDGSELCKGAVVEVLEERSDYGTPILTVKKI